MTKKAKYLIYFQLIYVLFSGLLIDVGFPKSIKYIMDMVTLLLAIVIVFDKNKKELLKHRIVCGVMLLWLVVTSAVSFVRGCEPLWIIWAYRNWARGFVFFAACIILLEKTDIEKLVKLFRISYFINFLIVIFEFLFLGQKGDYLGGIFGSSVGCNGYTNILLCIVLILSIMQAYKNNKLGAYEWFVFCSSMIIAALEEIKIFYYEYLAIIAICAILFIFIKKPDNRFLVKMTYMSLTGFVIGIILLEIFFPNSFSIILSSKSYFHYEETCRSAYKLSRSHGISEINDKWFGDDLALQLFGMGLGNCETASFDFLVSDFARLYGEWNYMFCCHHILYLEGGLVGLFLFGLIFVVIALESAFQLFKSKKPDIYNVMGIVFSLITIVSIVYNNGMRTEVQYMVYFVLAICCKQINRSDGQEGKFLK